MTIELPDLSQLTLQQASITLIILAVIDTAFAYIRNAAAGTFDFAYVAVWVQSHVLLRVFPIFALFALGSGGIIGGADFPAFFGAGLVALGGYLLETANSLIGTLRNPGTPENDKPEG